MILMFILGYKYGVSNQLMKIVVSLVSNPISVCACVFLCACLFLFVQYGVIVMFVSYFL